MSESSRKTKKIKPVQSETSTKTVRQIKKPSYKSFRLQKRIKPTTYVLPSSLVLLRRSIGTITRRWQLFIGIAIVYGILSFILVRGIGGSTNLTELKQTIEENFQGSSSVNTATSLFVYLLGSSATTVDAAAGVYQTILFIIFSLAVIWALRQAYASKLEQKIRVRDTLYRGMSPFVPFILVLLVIVAELLPVAVGSFLYSTVMSNGIAVTAIENVIWSTLFGLSILLSVYLIVSTIFALYVVALPDMTPMQALRSARKLVLGRRFIITLNLVLFALYWLVAVALVMIPFIVFAIALAPWVFFAITTLSLVVVHSYVYALYRELLNE